MSREVHAGFCERRGVRFPPATHLRVYVATERAGQRVMGSIAQYVERRLKLKVSRQKSAVDLAKKRRLLGFRFYGRDARSRCGSIRAPGNGPRIACAN